MSGWFPPFNTYAYHASRVLTHDAGCEPIVEATVKNLAGLTAQQTRKALSLLRQNGLALEIAPRLWVAWGKGRHGKAIDPKVWDAFELFEWHQVMLDETMETGWGVTEDPHTGDPIENPIATLRDTKFYGLMEVLTKGQWALWLYHKGKGSFRALNLSRALCLNFFEHQCDLYARGDLNAFRRWALVMLAFYEDLSMKERKLLGVRRYARAIHEVSRVLCDLLADDDLPPCYELNEGSSFHFLRAWDAKENQLKRTHEQLMHLMMQNAKAKRMFVLLTNHSNSKLYLRDMGAYLNPGETRKVSKFEGSLAHHLARGSVSAVPA